MAPFCVFTLPLSEFGERSLFVCVFTVPRSEFKDWAINKVRGRNGPVLCVLLAPRREFTD